MELDPSILSQLDWANREDRSSRTKTVNIVVISTTFLIVITRTLIRLGIVRRLGIEDIIILFAAVFAIGFSVEVLYALQFGLGKHVWLTAPHLTEIIPQVRQLLEVMFFANMTYFTSISLIKLSIIACYVRVFPNKAMRWVCGIIAFLVISTWICSVFTTIFTCKTVSDQWEFDNVNRQCIMVIPYYYFAAGMNGFTDLALTVAPVPLLLRIKVPLKEKAVLVVLFGMGLFAGACSLVRLASLKNLYSVDISFGLSDTLDWSSIELAVGIFCASVPSLKPLLGCWKGRDNSKYIKRPSGAGIASPGGTKGFEMLSPQPTPMMGYRAQISSPQIITKEYGSSEEKGSPYSSPRLIIKEYGLPIKGSSPYSSPIPVQKIETWQEEKEIGMAL